MSEYVHKVSDASFESDVLSADRPVLVDFWAEWCGPCRSIAPIVDEVAKELKDKIKVCKINVDENSETPSKYGVRGIPSLMIFKEGNLVAHATGAMTKAQLTAFINENS